ncbi:MAG: low temperature requirement protein A [Acidimicrobiia bacterium]
MGKIHPQDMFGRFRGRFWLPPRPHGEIIEDRTVSFLELFYDLVFVVLIGRASHTLSEHVSWQGVFDFAVVFGMIWLAWLNGTIHHELHGREDGRSRSFIFLQMMLLALLAVFTGEATGDGGPGFAITYSAILLVLTWLWYTVRRQDSAEYMQITGRYLAGMGISFVVIAATIPMPDEARTITWAVFVAGWIVGSILQTRYTGTLGVVITESMVERFGLFTIIVLGEVVVGVVNGLSEVDRTAEAIATGLLGLMLGFGFWWTYFDYVGRRMPRDHRPSWGRWMIGHLPVAMAIAAAGAAMVSLVEHAGDVRAPYATAWLLSGSVAVLLVALISLMRSLSDFDRLPSLYQPVSRALVIGAGIALLIGWWRPSPWLLVLTLAAIHSVIWFFAFDRWLRLEDPNGAIR